MERSFIHAQKFTQKLTISAIVTAMYVALMYLTQGIASGAVQIRISTGLYALGYLFPFLTVPLGAANSLSNLLFGGLGAWDIGGGFVIGLITAGGCALVRMFKLSPLFVIPIITLAPGLIVPLWLAPILDLPYWVLAPNIILGQTLPSVVGYLIITNKTISALKEGHSQ
jgi:hypothetical protein